MPSEWTAACKDCGASFRYSDAVHQDRLRRGLSAPERCQKHRERHAIETRSMASSHFGLKRAREPDLGGSPFLGAFDRSDRARPSLAEIVPDGSGMDLGLKDPEVAEIYAALETNKVLIVVAPTGAGKSTVIPFRLLEPLPSSGLPGDHFTQHGRKIVVTQPRRVATSDIPGVIARKMHGSTVGAGSEIGFRHGGDRDQTDPWNRLVFVTDGTLANWLAEQRAGEFSIVIVDEAHERSTTIDLILGLMKDELLRNSHLRLIILSATIQADAFARFFESDLPGRVWHRDFAECEKSHGYTLAWPDSQAAPGVGSMIEAVASTVLRLLSSTSEGGILAFLPGEGEIVAAVGLVRERLSGHVRERTLVLPLYGALPSSEQDKATQELKPLQGRLKGVMPRRVVISTNIAETSVTIPDVVHVIDSGLEKASTWDTASRTEGLRLRWNSQAGSRQRWGRAGRNRPGVVHPLYTEAQFQSFDPQTEPEVLRKCLDDSLIRAKRAGIGSLADLPWLDAPPEAELARVEAMARSRSLVDADGDVTEHGAEIFALFQRIARFVGDGAGAAAKGLDMAALLVMADRHGCLVEAATVVVLIQRMGERLYSWGGLLLFDADWPIELIDHVGRVHSSLRAGCLDDLDLGLKIVALCLGIEATGDPGGRDWASASYVNADTVEALLAERDEILTAFNKDAANRPMRALDPSLFARLRLLLDLAWPDLRVLVSEGERWSSGVDDPPGAVSLHSVARSWDGDVPALVASFGRPSPSADDAGGDAPVASTIVRRSAPGGAGEVEAVIAAVQALREEGTAALTRLFRDQRQPVGSTVESDDGAQSVVIRWDPGTDGTAVARTAPVREDLPREALNPGDEVEVLFDRAVAFLPTSATMGYVGIVDERWVYLNAYDLDFSGAQPSEDFVGDTVEMQAVESAGPFPRLSLLPALEEGWEAIRNAKVGSGRFAGRSARARGDAVITIMVEDPVNPGFEHQVSCVVPTRGQHLDGIEDGAYLRFELKPARDKEWTWELRDDDDEMGSRHSRPEAEAEALGRFGIKVDREALRISTILSSADLYAAIAQAPTFERAVRGLFRKSHELWAVPDALETSASIEAAATLLVKFREVWDAAWREAAETARGRVKIERGVLARAVISSRSFTTMNALLDDVWAIAEARNDAEFAAAKATRRRSEVASAKAGREDFIVRTRSRITKLRTDLATAYSTSFRERTNGWLLEAEAKLQRVLLDGPADQARWASMLAEAERLDRAAVEARGKLDVLRRRQWG